MDSASTEVMATKILKEGYWADQDIIKVAASCFRTEIHITQLLEGQIVNNPLLTFSSRPMVGLEDPLWRLQIHNLRANTEGSHFERGLCETIDEPHQTPEYVRDLPAFRFDATLPYIVPPTPQ